MDRANRRKLNEEREDLNSTINPLALTDIYKTLPNKSMHILTCTWDII